MMDHLRHPFGVYSAGQPTAEYLRRALQPHGTGHYLFESIAEVQDYDTNRICTYNHERPNIALGGILPIQTLAFVD